MGPEPYDQAAVAINQVVKRDGFYYAFYHANAQRPWKDWTTCVARSRDLVHWEKYPGNPIIQNNCSSAILVGHPAGRPALHHAPGREGVCSPPQSPGNEATASSRSVVKHAHAAAVVVVGFLEELADRSAPGGRRR